MTRTLFVVGAGASSEVGLPVGSQLKIAIADLLANEKQDDPQQAIDIKIFDAMQAAEQGGGCTVSELHRAAREIANAMRTGYIASIDDFIRSQSDREDHAALESCAKLAIVRAILRAEHGSSLMAQKTTKGKPEVRDSWLASFFEWLTRGVRGAADLESRVSQVAFVIFNYDRCIEYFLKREIHRHFPSGNSNVILRGAVFLHPYGTPGELYPPNGSAVAAPFGSDPTPSQLFRLINEIRTYHQSINEDRLAYIREQMRQAENIVFLGFAFHDQNLDLILPSDGQRFSKLEQVLGTAHGISEDGCRRIAGDLARRTGAGMGLMNIDHEVRCSELFDKYRYSLRVY